MLVFFKTVIFIWSFILKKEISHSPILMQNPIRLWSTSSFTPESPSASYLPGRSSPTTSPWRPKRSPRPRSSEQSGALFAHRISAWCRLCRITRSLPTLLSVVFRRAREQTGFSFYLESEWAGGQRVDKAGKGLLQAWKRQIQQFNRVSSDAAAAILAAYPSPQLLKKVRIHLSSISTGSDSAFATTFTCSHC